MGDVNGSGGRSANGIRVTSPVNHPSIFTFLSFSTLLYFFKIPTSRHFIKDENGEIATSNPLLSFNLVNVSVFIKCSPFSLVKSPSFEKFLLFYHRFSLSLKY